MEYDPSNAIFDSLLHRTLILVSHFADFKRPFRESTFVPVIKPLESIKNTQINRDMDGLKIIFIFLIVYNNLKAFYYIIVMLI